MRSSARDRADATVASMALAEKVGQLFVAYVTGPDAETVDAENRARFGVDTPAEAVATFHLGGVIYFAWSGNTAHPRQIARLSNGLQRAALAAGSRVPLSIATDQETGRVARIGPPATVLPDAMALGAARDPLLTRDAYAITGAELRALGLNLDYAPDADVNLDPANPVIGIRSFSSDPALVADLVVAAVAGLQSAGVGATAKHFPGHGDTATDSHTELPVVIHTREQWARLDAPPFVAAIAAGVDAIMTAHVAFPALDPSGRPATLSRAVVTGLLRDELGFDGVITTDSLRMAGVRALDSDPEIAVLALQAGVDVLLDPPHPAQQIRAVIEAVRSGRIAESRIDDSVRRILIMKHRRGVLGRPMVAADAAETAVGTAAHQTRARQIAERSTTVVTDEAGLVPLPRRRTLVAGWGPAATDRLAAGLTAAGRPARAVSTDGDWAMPAIGQSVAAAAEVDQVVVTTCGAWRDSGQRALVQALVATGRPVLVIALGDPYDLAQLAGVHCGVATYSATPVAVESALAVLTGRVEARGRLPVDLPQPGRPGTVRYPLGTGRSGSRR